MIRPFISTVAVQSERLVMLAVIFGQRRVIDLARIDLTEIAYFAAIDVAPSLDAAKGIALEHVAALDAQGSKTGDAAGQARAFF